MVPGPLLAVVVGVVLGAWSGTASFGTLSTAHFVNLPNLSGSSWGELFAGPDWAGVYNAQVWTTALTMAVMASLETLLSVEAADKLDPQRRIPPRTAS